MSKDFESLDQPLMVEIIRRRQQKDSAENNIANAIADLEVTSKEHSLEQDMKQFLATNTGKTFSDVQFMLNGKAYAAHKAILVARSSYFEGLFRSFAPEDNSVEVQIGDTVPSQQSFDSLLRYIYCGETCMPPEDSLYLFTAHSYYIFTNSRLQEFCKNNLRKVSIDNVIQILEAADKSNAYDMKQYALNLIVVHFPKIAKLPQLENLSKNLLLEILYAVADKMNISERQLQD